MKAMRAAELLYAELAIRTAEFETCDIDLVDIVHSPFRVFGRTLVAVQHGPEITDQFDDVPALVVVELGTADGEGSLEREAVIEVVFPRVVSGFGVLDLDLECACRPRHGNRCAEPADRMAVASGLAADRNGLGIGMDYRIFAEIFRLRDELVHAGDFDIGEGVKELVLLLLGHGSGRNGRNRPAQVNFLCVAFGKHPEETERFFLGTAVCKDCDTVNRVHALLHESG